MKHQKLITFLSKYSKISDSEQKYIEQLFKPINVRKKAILIEKNSTCNKLFFINSGMLRAFYINDKGKEITRMVAWEDRFLTNIASFKNYSENNETIECIKDANVIYINRKDFDELLILSSNLKSIYADILEEYNALHIKRFEVLNTFDVKKKIEHLQQYPNLIKELNDTILSSFIGISRETFARNKKFLSEY